MNQPYDTLVYSENFPERIGNIALKLEKNHISSILIKLQSWLVPTEYPLIDQKLSRRNDVVPRNFTKVEEESRRIKKERDLYWGKKTYSHFISPLYL